MKAAKLSRKQQLTMSKLNDADEGAKGEDGCEAARGMLPRVFAPRLGRGIKAAQHLDGGKLWNYKQISRSL